MTGKSPKKKERPGVDRMGRTPLHYAALEGKLDDAKRLLAEGVDPSARDDNAWAPLHFATQNWRVKVASLLLSSGAEVDARDSNGNTPLCSVSPVGLAKTIANYDVTRHFADLES